MKLSLCYVCGNPLTEENKSEEHVIPNAIGGWLRSKQLLCKKCNNETGSKADATLAQQFQFLSAYLQVKRDRGDIPVVKGGMGSDGTEYHLIDGSLPALARPKFSATPVDGGLRYDITARSEEEMRTMLKGIQRKFPQFDVNDAMIKATVSKRRVTDGIGYTQEFGGAVAFRSLLKTAVSFYILNEGKRDVIIHLLAMIMGRENRDVVKHYYPAKSIYKKAAGEVIHLLHLYGSKYERVLYCFIELFSLNSFLVVLSTDYDGNNVKHTYAYDVVSAKEVKKEVNLKLSRGKIQQLPTQFSDFSIMKDKADRVMGIADRIQTQKAMTGLFENAVDDIWKVKYGHEQRVTQQMIDELTDRVAEDMINLLVPGDDQIRQFDNEVNNTEI